ncbi:MAG: TatD family hydrolase [Luteolibacter sp.]
MTTWIDAHNHLQDARFTDAPAMIRDMKSAGISRCVANATSEADWHAVEKLALDHSDFILPAFGIHPWKAHLAKDGWEIRLRELLEKHPQASIGECGIDGWVSEPSLEIQNPVFLTQIRIARELQRPLTIHCLKAWQPLFDAFDQETPPENFLMHSFGGSPEIARRLIPLGAYFSFSGYFLHSKKAKVLEVFRQLPKDRILVETDAPDMLPPDAIISHPLPASHNHPANLPAIATAFAKALDLSKDALTHLTLKNFQHFYFPKP